MKKAVFFACGLWPPGRHFQCCFALWFGLESHMEMEAPGFFGHPRFCEYIRGGTKAAKATGGVKETMNGA